MRRFVIFLYTDDQYTIVLHWKSIRNGNGVTSWRFSRQFLKIEMKTFSNQLTNARTQGLKGLGKYKKVFPRDWNDMNHYWVRFFPRSNDLRYTSSKTFQQASSPLNDVVKTREVASL